MQNDDSPTSANASPPFTIAGRLQSFRYAFHGIFLMLRTQHNAWLHAIASVAVAIAALILGLSRFEWVVIVLAIAAVWMAEALNTAFEFLCDVASPGFHPQVKCAKDVAAGAVLIYAIGAAIIGLLVFVPHLHRGL